MLLIIGLTVFAAVCRKAIKISEKLSLPTWKLLSHVQFLLLLVCLWGLQPSTSSTPSSPPPVTTPPVSHPSVEWRLQSDNLLSSRDFSFGHVAIVHSPRRRSLLRAIQRSAGNHQAIVGKRSNLSGVLTASVRAGEAGWTIYFAGHGYSNPSFVTRGMGQVTWYSGLNHLGIVDSPRIDSIPPNAPPFGNGQNFSVNGTNFQNGLTVSVLAHQYGSSTWVRQRSSGSPWTSIYNHLGNTNSGQLPASDHLHFGFTQSDFPNFRRITDPRPTVVVSSSQTANDPGLLYWAQLLGVILLAAGTISTNVLGWVLYHKSKIEAQAARAIQRAELEKLKLENQKLAFELFQAKHHAETQRIILG